jgi:hypothetical protein
VEGIIMERSRIIGIGLSLVLAACSAPDCPTQSGATSCGYCNEDRATSSNPHAGMCTYCSGACGGDPCNPGCGGSVGGSCDSWVSSCGTTNNGVRFEGAPWPKACGNCPSGTYYSGTDDNVTAGGPYRICICNGF